MKHMLKFRAPDRVVLELDLPEFLVLYALDYLRGEGSGDLSDRVGGGLSDVVEDLKASSPKVATFCQLLVEIGADYPYHSFDYTRIQQILKKVGLS